MYILFNSIVPTNHHQPTSQILDVLEQERPKIILLDELDKFWKSWNKLLSLLEGGRVKVDQMEREYDFTIKGAKVFVSANDLNKLSTPLRSRFRRLHLPQYSREQFLQIVTLKWSSHSSYRRDQSISHLSPVREHVRGYLRTFAPSHKLVRHSV